jgi:LysR family transcriptional regulator, nitrogen assimilation regulatory protein
VDSRLIEYFLRVAELGSINKAADDLRLSQPALSRHIALLEHQLRAKLFTRTRGGVHLTESGALLVERARPILRQFAALVDQIGDRASGQLSIGLAPSWRNLFTTNYVARLVAEYPGVRLRVHEGVSHELREVMHAGMLDLAIVPFESSPPQGYVHTPLVREPLVLVGALDAGLRPDKPVPLSRLKDRKLALAGKQNFIRSSIENSMTRQQLELNLLFELDAMHLSMELAQRGVADTVTPCCAVSGNGYWESLISWSPIRGAYITWALCKNTARSHSQAVREGERIVLAMVNEIIRSGIWRGAELLIKGIGLQRVQRDA